MMSKKWHKILCGILAGALVLPIFLQFIVNADNSADGFPKKMIIGKPIPYAQFVDEKGNKASIDIKEGQYTIVTYWASWCSDCQEEFSLLPKLKPVLKEYDNVQWYLIDRADGDRETIKAAAQFVTEKKPGLPVLYDDKAKSFVSIGGMQIPTTLILNPKGEIVVCYPDTIKTQGHLRALLDYATKGADNAVYSYVKDNLLRSDGSVKVSESSAKTDVQAQSFLAQAAVNTFNRELLNQQRDWISKNKTAGNLGSDLRFLQALSMWRGYEGDSARLSEVIVKKYFPGNKLKGTVKLSNLDLQAMNYLHSDALVNEAQTVVEKGYISNTFPLYSTSYDADKKTYDQSSIDMTESLMTVYHLAQRGKVKTQTLDWLKNAVKSGSLSVRYTKDGTPVEKYREATPSVYALTAMIALETGDEKLFTEALCRMEQFRIFNSSSKKNGSFKTSSTNKAFDNSIALLLYSQMKQKMA